MIARHQITRKTHVAALLAASLATIDVRASDKEWTNPAGGAYYLATNWNPLGWPGAADTAVFNMNVSGDVLMGGATTSNRRLRVPIGTVRIDLNAQLYELTLTGFPASVVVGEGATGDGHLVLKNGLFASEHATIADTSGGVGHVDVDGAAWTMLNGTLLVGDAGQGQLDLINGAVVQSKFTSIGNMTGSDGAINVLGDSLLTTTFSIGVGASGTGSLTLDTGGRVECDSIYVSNLGVATADVMVVHPASSLTVAGESVIGIFGMGSLLVANGAQMTTGTMAIGTQNTGDGTATIENSLTDLTVNGPLSVGQSAVGALLVDDDATVSSTTGAIGELAGSVGTAELRGGSRWDATTGSIRVGLGGEGTLLVETGSSVSSPVNVNTGPGGVVQGGGTVDTLLNNVEGTVKPGESAGELFVIGDYIQQPGASLEIEIGGLTPGTQHDKLNVTGDATLDGTLDVLLIDLFSPGAEHEFEILSAATVGGSFSTINYPPLAAGLAWDIAYNPSDVTLRADSGPFGYKVSQWDPALADFVEQGYIRPYQTDLSVTDYYSYSVPNHVQANYPAGQAPEPVNDESQIFLAHSAVDGLVLCYQHDRSIVPLGGVGDGNAETEIVIYNDPNGAARLISDDPTEQVYTGLPGDSVFTSDQAWGNFTDGGVIGPLDGNAWAAEMQFTDVGPGAELNGLTSWRAYSANGIEIPLVLELDRPVRIEIVTAPPCPADVTFDDVVDVVDLLEVLGHWGACPAPCPPVCKGDVNGDCTVDVIDLLAVLAAWGPCP